MTPSTIGAYRIVGELGRGGMGAVYAAEHELLRKRVAIKVLLPECSRDDDIVQRFFNEARAAASIQHPGIVEVFDVGRDAAGAAYIVMELLRGESLAARLRRLGVLPLVTTARLVGHVAGALACAHRAGIVHRDLKPDNVFVVVDPDVAGGERAKVLDFGIAKLAADGAAGVKTRTGVVMGTPTYMAPEQCRGAREVDARADLYSLGVIVYEMLSGRPPFVADGLGELIAMHLLEPPPPLRAFAPQVPLGVQRVVERALAKEPEQRPPGVEALASALAAAVGLEVPAVSAVTIAGPWRPRGQRTRGQPAPLTTLGAGAGVRSAEHGRTRWAPVAMASGLVLAVGLLTVGGLRRVGDAADASLDASMDASLDASFDASLDAPMDAPNVAHDARLDASIDLPFAARAEVPPRASARAARTRTDTIAVAPTVVAPATPVLGESPERITLDRAERAHADGDPQRAIALARTVLRTPETRVGGLRVLVLAYCRLHNGEAARAAYGGLPSGARDGLSGPCARGGVDLE